MSEGRYLNTALNLIYLYLLKGKNGDGTGEIKKDNSWELVKQSAFDDFLDEYNSKYQNDTDLDKLQILKKGYPTATNKIGVYVYTLSDTESILVNYDDNKVYASIFIEIRIRDNQSDYIWKYQDALTDYLKELDSVIPIIILGTTYNKENQDTANYAVIRYDFVLDNISDWDD